MMKNAPISETGTAIIGMIVRPEFPEEEEDHEEHENEGRENGLRDLRDGLPDVFRGVEPSASEIVGGDLGLDRFHAAVELVHNLDIVGPRPGNQDNPTVGIWSLLRMVRRFSGPSSAVRCPAREPPFHRSPGRSGC